MADCCLMTGKLCTVSVSPKSVAIPTALTAQKMARFVTHSFKAEGTRIIFLNVVRQSLPIRKLVGSSTGM
jgi:hypothetical protein